MLIVLAGLLSSVVSFTQTDSIITFKDLKFHSAHEEKAYTNFVQYQSDTLEAFLAVDDLLSGEDVVYLKQKFEDIWKELIAKKVETKKINAQIKLVYSTVKASCLKTYVQEEYLSSTLLNGRYNEATSSILLALIFDRLNITYHILDSSVDFSMIANPGTSEQKLVVGSPIPVLLELSPEFKKQYVDFMRRTGKITDLEMRSNTTTELYDEKSKEQKQLTLKELLGMLYYFQSERKLELNDINGSLSLIQKGFYLYQTPYVQMYYLRCLAKKMEQFTVNNAADIDYLVQLYRVGNLDASMTSDIFKNVMANQLQYTDKASLCDSMYDRFISKVDDKELIDDVGFIYNLLRVNQNGPSYEDIFRVDKAVCIRPNLKEINEFLKGVIDVNLYKIQDEKTRMDSLLSLSKSLKSDWAKTVLKERRLYLLLDMASMYYKERKPKEGDKMLIEFETLCPTPIGNDQLRTEVERTFQEIANGMYWGPNQDVPANHKIVERGLKLVPDSKIIKSAWFEKGYVKYATDNSTTPVVKKLSDNTPKTGRTIRVISKNKKEKVYSF